MSFIVLVVVCINSATASKTSEFEEKLSSGTDVSQAVSTTDYDEKNKKIIEDQNWILGPIGEPTFSSPLVMFYAMNQRYPYNVAELLDAGHLLAWPADPATGKPLKLVENRRLKIEDVGMISYVRESDSNAYFEIVYFNPYDDETTVRKIPYEGFFNKAMENFDRYQSRDKVDIKIQNDFYRQMQALIEIALRRPEYRIERATPSGFVEAAHGNYFLIEENIKPDFISADPDIPLFLEAGIAVLNGKMVQFHECIFSSLLEPSGKERLRHFTVSTPLGLSMDSWSDQENFDALTQKEYYYSTRMLLDGTLEIPEEVLISKSEILGL